MSTRYVLTAAESDQPVAGAERELLQSVVELARHVFDSAAASVFLIDAKSGELVFEAVAGEGAGHLPGTRFPPGSGIAGWVAGSGEPLIMDHVEDSHMFARSAAAATGYVPASIIAAPLIRRDRCIGVLEVLDRRAGSRGEMADIDLLTLLAAQAAISLDMLIRAQRLVLDQLAQPEPGQLLRDISQNLAGADASIVASSLRLLAIVSEMLSQ